jgi:hypothetical protein
MKRIDSTYSLLAALLLLFAATGCVEPISPDQPVAPGARTLTLQIALPSATSLLTKAGSDDIVGPADERKVTSLQVWAFKHGADNDDNALVYLPNTETPLTDVLSNNPMEFTMSLPDGVMDAVRLDVPFSLDFYVLANGASFGLTESSPLAVVRNAVITGFGSGTSMVTSVPDAGLPMSVSLEDFDVRFLLLSLTKEQKSYIEGEWKDEKSLPASNPEKEGKTIFSDAQWKYLKTTLFANGKWDYSKVCVVLNLTRAVSKIRFVFAKAESMKPTTEITKIELVGASAEDILPKSTYLFPKKSGSIKPDPENPEDTGYEVFSWNDILIIPNDAPLGEDAFTGNTVDTPLRLRKDSTIESEITIDGTLTKKAPKDMSLDEYAAFLNKEIEKHHAIEKKLYLRESDKDVVKAVITYNIDDVEMPPVAIEISATAERKPFSRNTWWTVYAYFMSYELGFQVSVAPWSGKENSYPLE